MLSFVTLIAYDFGLALRTIQSYYHIADEILLGIDQDRISFSNIKFPFDSEEFFSAIKKLDTDDKIRVIQQNFHSHDHPMDNDQHERRVLASMCKPGNWIIQIDADEYLLNSGEFFEWIKSVPDDIGITGRWVTIFKQFDDEYLLIEEPDAFIAIGTKARDRYIASRRTDQVHIKSPLIMLHQAWGRSRKDLEQKLRNWAHSRDFNIENYLKLWDSVNLDNYTSFKNFHPISPGWWPSLEKVQFKTPESGRTENMLGI